VKAFFVTRRLAFESGITKWRHVEQLQKLGITHVINLRRNVHDKKVRQFECLWLPFKDDKKLRPRWFYRKALTFYGNSMRRPDSKVFVMCRLGICRSASLAYFLLRTSGMSEKQAWTQVSAARPWATLCRAYRDSGDDYLRWAGLKPIERLRASRGRRRGQRSEQGHSGVNGEVPSKRL
jgi:hypothetical protein